MAHIVGCRSDRSVLRRRPLPPGPDRLLQACGGRRSGGRRISQAEGEQHAIIPWGGGERKTTTMATTPRRGEGGGGKRRRRQKFLAPSLVVLPVNGLPRAAGGIHGQDLSQGWFTSGPQAFFSSKNMRITVVLCKCKLCICLLLQSCVSYQCCQMAYSKANTHTNLVLKVAKSKQQWRMQNCIILSFKRFLRLHLWLFFLQRRKREEEGSRSGGSFRDLRDRERNCGRMQFRPACLIFLLSPSP